MGYTEHYLLFFLHISVQWYMYVYTASPPTRSTFQTCQQMVEKHVVGVRQGNVRCGLFTTKAKMWVKFFCGTCAHEGSSFKHRRRDNMKEDDNLDQDICCKDMRQFVALPAAASPSCCLYSGRHEPLDQRSCADPEVLAATPVLVLG